jgi:hypothetical protein
MGEGETDSKSQTISRPLGCSCSTAQRSPISLARFLGLLTAQKNGGHGTRTRNPLRGTSFPMMPLAIRLPSRIPNAPPTVRKDGQAPAASRLAHKGWAWWIWFLSVQKHILGALIHKSARTPFLLEISR